MMNMFTSVFLEKLNAMLDYRVTCGLKRETYISHLVKFDKYCAGQKCDVPDLNSDVVYGWLEDEVVRDIPAKAMAIRLFGKYLCAVGEDAYVLPKKFSHGRKTNPPYIFTDGELTALFTAIDKLASTKNEPHLSKIAPVLFRLTYTCGLRPNESRELLCKNVNLESGEILITNTKKNKERIVVMSDDMRRLCCRYDLQRSIFGGQNQHFFHRLAAAHCQVPLCAQLLISLGKKRFTRLAAIGGKLLGFMICAIDLLLPV